MLLFTVDGHRILPPEEKEALDLLVNVVDFGNPGVRRGRLDAGISDCDDT